jgi:hypothetical protein
MFGLERTAPGIGMLLDLKILNDNVPLSTIFLPAKVPTFEELPCLEFTHWKITQRQNFTDLMAA